MAIKMIATDLDRTLLRKDKTLSDYTMSIFRRCRAKGLKIVFATSRPMPAVVNFDFCRQIAPDASLYHSGAVIYAGNTCIERHSILPQAVNKILLSAGRNAGIKLAIEVDDKNYGNFDPPDIWPGVEVNRIDYANPPFLSADKIIFVDLKPDIIESISKILPENLYLEISENRIGMIMNKNATKSKGVARIAQYYGIPLSDVAAFGDDYNDIGMLRECGIGVAVANAIDETKAAADYICDTNDNDGMAKWLEENVLNKTF